jgi:hypothetical protein
MHCLSLRSSFAAATKAGLFGIWQPKAFAHVDTLDAWEDEVADDRGLSRAIAEGTFVPINIGGDGAFQFEVRGTDEQRVLTARERSYLVVSSERYLLVSDGTVASGGLESVGAYGAQAAWQFELDPGKYSVSVHLLDWRAEPGYSNADGSPRDGALPDFVVLLSPELAAVQDYRQSVETFVRPS